MGGKFQQVNTYYVSSRGYEEQQDEKPGVTTILKIGCYPFSRCHITPVSWSWLGSQDQSSPSQHLPGPSFLGCCVALAHGAHGPSLGRTAESAIRLASTFSIWFHVSLSSRPCLKSDLTSPGRDGPLLPSDWRCNEGPGWAPVHKGEAGKPGGENVQRLSKILNTKERTDRVKEIIAGRVYMHIPQYPIPKKVIRRSRFS